MDEYAKNRLKSILMDYHVGQVKAIHKDELLNEVFGSVALIDKSNNNIYDRSMRAMIEHINTKESGMICSDPSCGYWWAASLSDGLPAAQKLLDRASTQRANAQELIDNMRHHFGGQLDFMHGGKG